MRHGQRLAGLGVFLDEHLSYFTPIPSRFLVAVSMRMSVCPEFQQARDVGPIVVGPLDHDAVMGVHEIRLPLALEPHLRRLADEERSRRTGNLDLDAVRAVGIGNGIADDDPSGNGLGRERRQRHLGGVADIHPVD